MRRRQVLDAAAECFRESGFHGSSIARICEVAGMSPGHIYHYFANKEAIIEALAAREENETLELIHRMKKDREGGDVVTRLARQTSNAVRRYGDPSNVGLILELASEGARNPNVRDILQRADEAAIRKFLALAEQAGKPASMDDAEFQLRARLIMAMFNGLMVRGVVDPAFDRQGFTRLINWVIRLLLDDIDSSPA